MEKFEVQILGCGSAQPTLRHNQTSQIVNVNDHLYMIDCGEGTQQQFRRHHLNFNRLNNVFISHLHGDHCFGLPGLASTFALRGRTAPLHIYAPSPLEDLLRPWMDYFLRGSQYEILLHTFSTHTPDVIYEDKTVSVSTVPLNHRIPCCGFIVKEQPKLPAIRRDMIDFYQIPVCHIANIKNGADWTLPDGTCVPNSRLVLPARPPRSYAYLSDTAFSPSAAQQAEGASLLFHEATFAEADLERARETFHSTARQAAQAAQLAHARQLLIGHFSSRYTDEATLLQEAQEVFPNTVLAEEGGTVRVE